MIPSIILSIQLNNQIIIEKLIDYDSTSDFISQKLVNRNLITLQPHLSVSSILLHNAFTNKFMQINKELLTKIQFQSSVKVKVKSSILLKVASLVSHDVILGMLFLKQNDLLIDPIARTIIPRKQSLSIVEQDHYIKVDNALMQISKSTMRTLSHHAIKTDRAFSKVIIHHYTIRLTCCAIAMKDIHYKQLNTAFMKQYSDIFSKILPFKLPSESDSKHHIILKNDRFINDKLMRISTRY